MGSTGLQHEDAQTGDASVSRGLPPLWNRRGHGDLHDHDGRSHRAPGQTVDNQEKQVFKLPRKRRLCIDHAEANVVPATRFSIVRSWAASSAPISVSKET